MKFVIGNFKKVFTPEETENVLKDYSISFSGDKICFCVLPECSEMDCKFKLFSQHEDDCGRVLIGHSDFKMLYHLSDKDVLKNAIHNLKLGSEIVLCVGENAQQKEEGKSKNVLKNQLKGLKKLSGTNLTVVYEPVYALGKETLPSLTSVIQNIEFIKKCVPRSPVLYGGSVNDKNVDEILQYNSVDGVFLHRASLNKEKLSKIITCAKKYL